MSFSFPLPLEHGGIDDLEHSCCFDAVVLSKDGGIVANFVSGRHADEVIRAINVHDEMLAILREAGNLIHSCKPSGGIWGALDDRITTVVVKAEGRPVPGYCSICGDVTNDINAHCFVKEADAIKLAPPSS